MAVAAHGCHGLTTNMKKLLLISTLALAALASGCAVISYDNTKVDGSRVHYSGSSLFSNTAFKGLVVDGTTKTTTNGLRITAGATEPNADSITASGEALGNMVGAAAKTAAKP